MADNAIYPVALDDEFREWIDKHVTDNTAETKYEDQVILAQNNVKFRKNGRRIEWLDVHFCLLDLLEKYEIRDDLDRVLDPKNLINKNGSAYFVLHLKNKERSWGAKFSWSETFESEITRNPNYEHYFSIEDSQ